MSEEINTRKLGALVKSKRGDLGLRGAAKDIGISAATLGRIESGKAPDIRTLGLVCKWLGVAPTDFLGEETVSSPHSTNMGPPPGMGTPEVIAAYLRNDRTLSREAADKLADLVRLAYEVARQEKKE